MTIGVAGEPTFYLNDLAGTADVDVSGVKSLQEMDEKPVTTYTIPGTITGLTANDAQAWFQFKGGKIDGNVYDSVYDHDLMYGVKSVTDTKFPTIPDQAENNTTLRFHQYNLQDDYLGTLSEKVFGFSEGANLFANVDKLKEAYNTSIEEATKSSNNLMNDIKTTMVNDVDVSKKLAKTIMAKYPERYELKFQAKFGVDTQNVPNGYLGYDSTKPPGKQTTEDWIVYNQTAVNESRGLSNAVVKVTLSEQNKIYDIVMTQQGDGYKMDDKVYLVKDVTQTAENDRFIIIDKLLDVQANTFNQSVNLEDVLYSDKISDIDGREQENASLSRRLFLPGLTSDASVVQRDAVTNIKSGYQATVDVSCGDGVGVGDVTSGNDGAVFKEMTVTTRGYDYEEGKNLFVFKNNAIIEHTIDADDAVKLNLGVLTVDKAIITSLPVYNNGASGEVVSVNSVGSGAMVTVDTKDMSGIDVSFIEMYESGAGYVEGETIRITNPDNSIQTIDFPITKADANLLNGVKILDLSYGNPTIDTRSFRTTDEGVPEKVLGKTDRGNVVELEVANNGTWVKKVTVRDGATTGDAWTVNDTIIITNIHEPLETLELSGAILDASFVSALNRGEEYILTDNANGVSSLTDSSNALTNALTGGIYFEDATTYDVQTLSGDGDGTGVQITVSCTTEQFSPILELYVGDKDTETEDRSNITGTFMAGDVLLFRNEYQTITKEINFEDANLLNGVKEIVGVGYPGNGDGNDLNNRIITSTLIFTDGAYGTATGVSGSGAVIRVDTNDVNDSVISVLTVRTPGAGYTGTGDVIIRNLEDDRQSIRLTIDSTATDNSVRDIEELNDSGNKVLSIVSSDIPYLYYGGVSKDVQAVKNGVNNKHSEAVVTIVCDGNQSEGGNDRGASIKAISLQSASIAGTDNTSELYYQVGDSVTFTVDENGEHLNQDNAINQDGTHVNTEYTVKYIITIANLTLEQVEVLNGKQVGTNVPLLPGDVLVLMSTIKSPAGIEGQEQFEQSFLTEYHLA